MITKFDLGDIVKVVHKKEVVYGKVILIAISEGNPILYELFLEKPIHNRDKAWYDEEKITLQRRARKK